jgi:hypothetical protein
MGILIIIISVIGGIILLWILFSARKAAEEISIKVKGGK